MTADAAREQRLLRDSILVTLALAALGVGVGLGTGSAAITFDGIMSLFDAVMVVLALLVTRAIHGYATASTPTHRFRLGFWHLEPMLLAAEGLLLAALLVYALVDAAGVILAGGRSLAFDWAMAYAAVAATVGLGMHLRQKRANRVLQSGFLDIDAKSWLMAGAISTALLIAFSVGWAIQGTRHEALSAYVDPAALALVCLALLPTPLGIVRRAGADLLLMAPPELIARADAAAAAAVAAHDLAGARTYVARTGRLTEVEIHFLVPAGRAFDVAAMDRVRAEVSDAVGGYGPHRWLTVAFTADPRWID